MSHSDQQLDASDQQEPRSLSSNAQAPSEEDVSSVDFDFDGDDVSSVGDFSIITQATPAVAVPALATPAIVTGITTTAVPAVATTAVPAVATTAVPTVATPAGTTPVVQGVQYTTVPTSDMVYNAADEQLREWYVVTRGLFIGVFKYSFLVDQATRKVSSAHGKKEDSLRDAVDHFNAARASGWMRICVGQHDLELSDRDEICNLIRALSITEERAERQRVAADETFYRVGSGMGATGTAHWATAGTAQLGGAHVVAEKKRTKKRQKRLRYHVVFIGQPSGIHDSWASAKAATEGVPGNCLKGYATQVEAQAAWDYAQQQGWVRGPNGERPIPHVIPVPFDAHGNAAPALTPLSPKDKYRQYYCVYRGQRPGIYGSIIEANLSAVGVRTALHQAYSSITVAREKYNMAVANNEIHIIPMP